MREELVRRPYPVASRDDANNQMAQQPFEQQLAYVVRLSEAEDSVLEYQTQLDECRHHKKGLEDKLDRQDKLLKACAKDARQEDDEDKSTYIMQIMDLSAQLDEERLRADIAEQRLKDLKT